MTPEFDNLLARTRALAAGSRAILGIAGAPGSGKSTLALRLVDALAGQAVLVAMDGFHLAQRELNRLGRTERKGAPDTFDAAGYLALLHRLRHPEPGSTVYAPLFRREIEEPVAGAVAVPADVPLVITEGNYLLLDQLPWSAVRPLLDQAWFLAPDEPTRRAWLTERHRRYGRTPAEASERVAGSDERNAMLVAPTAARADLIVDPRPEPPP